MKGIQKKISLVLFGISAVAVSCTNADNEKTNEIGQPLWSTKTQQEYLKLETDEYNEDSFKSELSTFALHEWYQLTPEQKKKAMEYADKTQLSPDAAVLKVDPNY
jgi:hypothetical protein